MTQVPTIPMPTRRASRQTNPTTATREHARPDTADALPTLPDEEYDDYTGYESAAVRPLIPKSQRRYHPIDTPTRTVLRMTHHQGLPPRASRTTGPQQPAQREYAPRSAPPSMHLLFAVGVGMLATLVCSVFVVACVHWWQTAQDTMQYGNPRTFQCDTDVKHGGVSHFTVENLDGSIFIVEVQKNDLTRAHIYQGPSFSGPGADLQPATLSFEDVNGDGYPDMVVTVSNTRYILVNDHTGFRAPTPADHIKEG